MKERAGTLLQLTGLILLPVAVVFGLRGGDIFTELLLATGGVALLLMGRSLR